MRLIDADVLCEYANNMKDKTVDANDIMRFPVIEAEPVRHGNWIVQDGCVQCSECGEPNMEWNYCPFCGAKMVNDDPSHPFADDVMMGD